MKVVLARGLLLASACWFAVPAARADHTLSPASGSGAQATFTVTVTVSTGNDPFGVSDVTSAQLLFNYGFDGSGACYMVFSLNGGLFLLDDTATFAVTPDSSGNMSNSQCTVSPARNVKITHTPVGDLTASIEFEVDVTFTSAFKGVQNIYMHSAGTHPLANPPSSWSTIPGTWTA